MAPARLKTLLLQIKRNTNLHTSIFKYASSTHPDSLHMARPPGTACALVVRIAPWWQQSSCTGWPAGTAYGQHKDSTCAAAAAAARTTSCVAARKQAAMMAATHSNVCRAALIACSDTAFERALDTLPSTTRTLIQQSTYRKAYLFR